MAETAGVVCAPAEPTTRKHSPRIQVTQVMRLRIYDILAQLGRTRFASPSGRAIPNTSLEMDEWVK